MPHLIWSRRSLSDIARLQAFLEQKSTRAATRAVDAILAGADRLMEFPALGRPVDELPPDYRELVIPFGASGYILRYRTDGDVVVVVAIRHAHEAGF